MLLPPVAFSHHCTCMHLCARDLHRSACHAPQPSVGTVVRTGEEEDPIAVMTVLNTVTHAAAPWARQVRAQLLAKCSQPAERDSLAKVCACMPTTSLPCDNCQHMHASPAVGRHCSLPVLSHHYHRHHYCCCCHCYHYCCRCRPGTHLELA